MRKLFASFLVGASLVIAPFVSAASKPQVSCTLTTVPQSIQAGVLTPVTLVWTTSGAKSGTILGFSLKEYPSGSLLLLLDHAQTYSFTAVRGNESAVCSTTISTF